MLTLMFTIRCAKHEKGPYALCRQRRSKSVCVFVPSALSNLCLSTYTTVSTDSVSEQLRPNQLVLMRRLIWAYVVHKLHKGPFLLVCIINIQTPLPYLF